MNRCFGQALLMGWMLAACSDESDAPADSPADAAGADAPMNTTDAPVSYEDATQTLLDAAPDASQADARMADASEGESAAVDPCAGGPELPDAEGPMQIVLFGPGFAGLPFSIDGVYDMPADTEDVCGDAEAGSAAFSVTRTNAAGVTVRARFSNAISNLDRFPPVRDDYTEEDYLVFELETVARVGGSLMNFKFGAGGGGRTGLYAGSRLEGSVGADLEETGRLDAHFRIWQMVYPTVSGDGGVTMGTTAELLCLWIVGSCRIPLE